MHATVLAAQAMHCNKSGAFYTRAKELGELTDILPVKAHTVFKVLKGCENEMFALISFLDVVYVAPAAQKHQLRLVYLGRQQRNKKNCFKRINTF